MRLVLMASEARQRCPNPNWTWLRTMGTSTSVRRYLMVSWGEVGYTKRLDFACIAKQTEGLGDFLWFKEEIGTMEQQAIKVTGLKARQRSVYRLEDMLLA